MAFFGNKNNNQQKKYSPTVYSAFSMSSTKVETPSRLGYFFWNKFLAISITPLIKSPNGGQDFNSMVLDTEHSVNIYLRPQKAFILARMIEHFIETDGRDGVCVINNNDLINITNGSDGNPCITFIKHNDDGAVVANLSFSFRTDEYHFGGINYDFNTNDCTRVYDKFKYLDLESLITVLDEFYRAMTYAQAYACNEAALSVNYKQNQLLQGIATKLGVNVNKSGGSYTAATDMSAGVEAQFSEGSIDDIM